MDHSQAHEPAGRPGSLCARVAESHDRALAALQRPGDEPLAGVVWAAAHLSAMEHVLLPLARRLPEVDEPDFHHRTAALHRLLRRLETHHSGDAAERVTDASGARESAVALMREHAESERRMCQALDEQLDGTARRKAVQDYLNALQHGPTRPHPGAPASRLLEPLAYRLNALRDRALDVMDARSRPATELTPPRPVRPHRRGPVTPR